ncbi:hypothetical protein L6452_34835 [Arctium lappa]|uniref:Uncharacterized protein n=1 Tax=Arctium lappa TaxID=4217 RepID=A0ACB8YKF5_ARCLA|nr:hypothetical protein L6452_34835 [Arctium lappa]
MVAITPFAGSNPSNLPIQNRFARIANTSTQTTYSQLIQRPVMCSPTTPSKKETLVTLGSTKFVANTSKNSASSSNASNIKEKREDGEGSPLMSLLYRTMSVKWWEKLPQQQASNMTVQSVVNYFTDSTGFGVQSQLDPTQSSLPTQDEEEELLRLMRAPTKEELRQLVQEIKKNAAQNSPPSSDEQENVPNLFQDA